MYVCRTELMELSIEELEPLYQDAVRYRWLRERDVNAIHDGGLFVGITPGNVVLNGDDLDIAIDAAMTPNVELTGSPASGESGLNVIDSPAQQRER